MSGTQDIINAVNNDEKLKNSRSFRDRIYTDQPIIRTASKLKRPDVPEKIREMKNLAFTPEAYWKTSAWLFRTQGMFMTDYTDDLTYYEDFTAYYPTYRDLTTEQLRGYFTWRSHIRNGEYPRAPKAFILIYMYEMINCIGVSSAQDAFFQLRVISENYSDTDTDIARLSVKWLNDIVVYYGLPTELLSGSSDFEFDNAVLRLMDYGDVDRDQLFAAIMRLSAYNIEKSAFYSEMPELFSEAACRVYIKLYEYYRDHRKNSLCEKLFGRPVEMKYRMFESAVFFDTMSDRNCVCRISDIQTFSSRNGEWFCEKLHGNRGKNKPLGELMRTVDSILREKTGIAHRINCGDNSRNTIKLAEKLIEKLIAESSVTKPADIEIDLSALDNIRSAADITRERLIVDEEICEESVPEPISDIIAESPVAEQKLLDKIEKMFIRALLYGGDYKKAAMDNGCLPSVIADSINEKLFETFSDTVIEFDGDEPIIIEDYTDELKELFPD